MMGIGLRPPHYETVLRERPPIPWFEVHSENFFHAAPALATLCAVRQHYPISLHGVGLSLGSVGVDSLHLQRLQQLIARVEPFLISEHLSWSRVGGVYLPDLLPLPYTSESLAIFAQNILQTQEFLGREILIENPSSYVEYTASCYSEAEFLVTLCQRTGAGILLDLNNVFVSCENHGWDAKKYIDAIPAKLIKEIHVAGHATRMLADRILRVDTHDAPVCQAVWQLYTDTLQKCGPVPTLLEWDANIPSLAALQAEAAKALYYGAPLYA